MRYFPLINTLLGTKQVLYENNWRNKSSLET